MSSLKNVQFYWTDRQGFYKKFRKIKIKLENGRHAIWILNVLSNPNPYFLKR